MGQDVQEALETLRQWVHQEPSFVGWGKIWDLVRACDDPVVEAYAAEQMARWPERYHLWAKLMAFRFKRLNPNSFRCVVVERAEVQAKLLPLAEQGQEPGVLLYPSKCLEGRPDPFVRCREPIVHELDTFLELFFADAFDRQEGLYGPYAQPEPPQDATGHYTGGFRALGQDALMRPELLSGDGDDEDDWDEDDEDWDSPWYGVCHWCEVSAESALPLWPGDWVHVESVEEYQRSLVGWSINNKWYTVVEDDGSLGTYAWSRDPGKAKQIAAQEAEHKKLEKAFLALFAQGLGENARCFTAMHPGLERHHTGPFDGDLARDGIVAVVDDEHIRVFWVNHHRLYG